MTFGYHGNYLRLHLSGVTTESVSLSPETLRRCIGGVGLGVEVLASESSAGYDPLGQEAPLVFVASPLVGTPLTTSAKFAVVAKSPLTDRICDAMCSSHFALAMKRLGADALCLLGRAERLSVLFLDGLDSDGVRASLVDADEWRGLSAFATENAIHDRFGADWRVVSIGPAGEMQIPFATLSHDGRHAGRGGLGAVLGSKNIKAIAVRGDKRVPIADQSATVAIAKRLSELSFTPATSKYSELGTVSNLLVFNRFQALPTRNFERGDFDHVADLAPHDLAPARKIARSSCAACTIGCEHIYELRSKTPHGGNPAGVRMEYESLFALGPLCGISDPQIVLEAAALCDSFGLDTISVGGTAAFLMTCAEKGLIEANLKNGSRLHFGDGPAILALIREMISDAPGNTARLACLGSRKAAEAIGRNAVRFAPQVKGMEMPGYHPRTLHAMALGMAVGSRGADHNRTGAYEVDFSGRELTVEETAAAVVDKENRAILMDSLILCKFIRGVFTDFYAEAAEMLRAVTGFDYSPDGLDAAAAGIVEARKRFNVREGWNPAEDMLPDVIFESSPDSGTSSDRPPLTLSKLNSMIAAYNAARGWSFDGYPPNAISASADERIDDRPEPFPKFGRFQ